MISKNQTTAADTHQDAGDPTGQSVTLLTIVHHEVPGLLGLGQPLGRKPLVLGRGAACFAPGALEQAKISRQHAQVWRDGGSFRIRDLESRNGTFVNGERVTESALAPGDVVGIGDLLLLFHESPGVASRARHPTLVGSSHALAAMLEEVDLVALRDTPVLLLGETGAGKELLAREVHERSGRRGRLVAVNVGALSDGVLQSELFGHARGAFSGADKAREGLVVEADGGTLFLDEIGEASASLQVALLRLLQEREIRAVGANQVRQVDVRFVAATHRDLGAMVTAGRFREDLWQRLSRWVVRVPPLRERREDIPHLALHFAKRHAGRAVKLDRQVTLALLTAPWPGNVRQLDAVVERLVVGARGADELSLPPWLRDTLTPTAPQAPAAERTAASPRRQAPRPSREDLQNGLHAADMNMRAFAMALGVSRTTLYRWCKELGVDVVDLRRSRGGSPED